MFSSINTNFILAFGKYKGKKVIDVISINPKYIAWCINKGLLYLTPAQNSYLQIELNDTLYDDAYDHICNPHCRNEDYKWFQL